VGEKKRGRERVTWRPSCCQNSLKEKESGSEGNVNCPLELGKSFSILCEGLGGCDRGFPDPLDAIFFSLREKRRADKSEEEVSE